jgi:sodium transport system permease protein
MRWSIIRLIWLRELRDQLRDRRTVFMITILPLLLYPVLGMGVLSFALNFPKKAAVLGVVNVRSLPASGEPGLDQVPPLLLIDGKSAHFSPAYLQMPAEANAFQIKLLDDLPAATSLLERRQLDLVLVVPPDFSKEVRDERLPDLSLRTRDDDSSRLQTVRVQQILDRWRKLLKKARFDAHKLPPQLDEIFNVHEEGPAGGDKKAASGVFDALVRVFPFLLVMWALTGGLYPAVDLCAGEKERGTMETLLISPASREEIVYGKFLTIWVFSGATALLNLLSIGLTTWRFAGQLPAADIRPVSLLWCVLLVLPLSAFFSALCLAIGAYARSSKEGQYYLLPLFLITMPLIFLTLAPGVELNAFYSMIPVTGVALLLQRLLTAPDQVPWIYFPVVLGPMVLYGWLSLRWAVYQFQREEVLFREAERLDIALWLRHLWRAKEAIPSFGQALFCFAVVLGLHWLSFGLGDRLPAAVRTCISALAFVATPPAFLAVMLTTRPLQSLGLRIPGLQFVALAAALAVLLLPLSELALLLLNRPEVKEMFQIGQPLTGELLGLRSLSEEAGDWWSYLLLFLPLLCQEVAFRGFILTGLRRRFHPLTAVVLSSLLYALFSLNVFEALPAFCLGLVLGVLATRSGSVLPGMLFHLLHGGLLIGAGVLQRSGGEEISGFLSYPVVVATCTLLAVILVVAAAYRHLALVWASDRT